jgi:hypothetical protein
VNISENCLLARNLLGASITLAQIRSRTGRLSDDLCFYAAAELGSDNPTDATLLIQREVEAGCDISTTPPTCPSGTTNVFNSGTFDIASPPAERRSLR